MSLIPRLEALRESGVLPPPVSELLSQRKLPRIPNEPRRLADRMMGATGDLQLAQEVATLGALIGNDSERTAMWKRVTARVDRDIAVGLLPQDALDIAVGPALLATMATEYVEPGTRQVDIDLVACAYCGYGTPAYTVDVREGIIIKTPTAKCANCAGPQKI